MFYVPLVRALSIGQKVRVSEAPWVAVIMGSRSDLEHLSPAIELLSELGIPHEVRIVSAHRTPDWMFRVRRGRRGRGASR
jgi:5-(carboxyamino)imidazole ribonucleotide mutase